MIRGGLFVFLLSFHNKNTGPPFQTKLHNAYRLERVPEFVDPEGLFCPAALYTWADN